MALANSSVSEWPYLKKLLICFFFIFFFLYIFFNPNQVIPYSFYLHTLYMGPCTHIIEWFAKDVFHIVSPAVKFYNGTVDTVFGYVTVLFILITAILGSFLWIAINKKTFNYHRLYETVIVVLRYYLAVTWIAYGSLKIAHLQFPPFSPDMLLQTYGNSTPKELAWSFMGYSTAYNCFIGLTEYAVGLLLFFRRASALGNMLGLGIIINVVAFNYSYDVNVKLLATVLMLMALFVLSKDIKRLIKFFFSGEVAHAIEGAPFRFKKKWKNTALQAAKYGFILYIVFFDLRGAFARAKQERAKNQPFFGVYDVSVFIRNKDTIKPLATDTKRWNKLIVSPGQDNASILFMDNSLKRFIFKQDIVKKRITIYDKTDTTNKYTFTYNEPKDSILTLRGAWNNDSLGIKLQQYDLRRFPIMKRGFRWIIDRNFKNQY